MTKRSIYNVMEIVLFVDVMFDDCIHFDYVDFFQKSNYYIGDPF